MMDFIGMLAAQDTFKRHGPRQTEDAFYQFYASASFPRLRRAWSLLKMLIALRRSPEIYQGKVKPGFPDPTCENKRS
jgi:hypothetical protein